MCIISITIYRGARGLTARFYEADTRLIIHEDVNCTFGSSNRRVEPISITRELIVRI